MNYYWLSGHDSAAHSVAYSPKGSPLSHYLAPIIEKEKLSELPFPLSINSISIDNTGLKKGPLCDEVIDFQPNNLAWPLMSSRLKETIESSLTGQEPLRWISARLVGKTVEYIYYLPFFTAKMDVLDINRSVFVGPWHTLLKPYYDSKKASLFSIFNGDTMFWQISSRIYVNEVIKKEIETMGLTGICFIKARMTP